MKTIHELLLGEAGKLCYWDVMRVPGGWIFDYGNSQKATSVFVPYSNEFNKRIPPPTPIPSSGTPVTNPGF